jgi:hypothetical protein
MLNFRYNHLQNSLSYQSETDEYWNEVPFENQFEGNFGSQGFKLNSGYITFTIYDKKIRVFYKEMETPAWITYYRKDLVKEWTITFTFEPTDEVEKVDGKWRRKYG